MKKLKDIFILVGVSRNFKQTKSRFALIYQNIAAATV